MNWVTYQDFFDFCLHLKSKTKSKVDELISIPGIRKKFINHRLLAKKIRFFHFNIY